MTSETKAQVVSQWVTKKRRCDEGVMFSIARTKSIHLKVDHHSYSLLSTSILYDVQCGLLCSAENDRTMLHVTRSGLRDSRYKTPGSYKIRPVKPNSLDKNE